jgi:uncharacterized membrane protein
MADTLKASVAGFVTFIVLDGLWLGVVMRNFYRAQLASIARMANGALAPIWPVAALVYVLMAIGAAVFVVPRATSAGSAAGLGALFGLVSFGIYDLTNYSTLTEWPLAMTLTDIGWGMTTFAVGCVIAWAVAGR